MAAERVLYKNPAQALAGADADAGRGNGRSTAGSRQPGAKVGHDRDVGGGAIVITSYSIHYTKLYEANYENFYIRPHQSGNPDANQYQPVFNGSASWQLYYGPEYAAPVEYRYDLV